MRRKWDSCRIRGRKFKLILQIIIGLKPHGVGHQSTAETAENPKTPKPARLAKMAKRGEVTFFWSFKTTSQTKKGIFRKQLHSASVKTCFDRIFGFISCIRIERPPTLCTFEHIFIFVFVLSWFSSRKISTILSKTFFQVLFVFWFRANPPTFCPFFMPEKRTMNWNGLLQQKSLLNMCGIHVLCWPDVMMSHANRLKIYVVEIVVQLVFKRLTFRWFSRVRARIYCSRVHKWHCRNYYYYLFLVMMYFVFACKWGSQLGVMVVVVVVDFVVVFIPCSAKITTWLDLHKWGVERVEQKDSLCEEHCVGTVKWMCSSSLYGW